MAVFAYNHGNFDAAFRTFLPMAEHGNAEAQYYVGVMYSEGQGVSRDDGEAVKWCRRAAARGDPNARFIIGLQIASQPDPVSAAKSNDGAAPTDLAVIDELSEAIPAATLAESAPVYELSMDQVAPESPSEPTPADEPSPAPASTARRTSRAKAPALENGVAAYRFVAAMRIDTPLEVLEMHDRLAESNDELGDYAVGPDAHRKGQPNGQYGHWQPVSENHDGAEDRQPSELGPIRPSDFLPFLKAFRTIVESDRPAERQAVQICALRQTWPVYWEKLSKNFDTLDERWFVAGLCVLPGIGRNAAKGLYAAGSLRSDQVLALPDDALLAIRGIGKATLAKLRAASAV